MNTKQTCPTCHHETVQVGNRHQNLTIKIKSIAYQTENRAKYLAHLFSLRRVG